MMASQNAASLGASPYSSNPASPGPYVPTQVHPTGSSSPTSVGGMQQPFPVIYANQVPTNYIGTGATIGGQVQSNYSGMPRL